MHISDGAPGLALGGRTSEHRSLSSLSCSTRRQQTSAFQVDIWEKVSRAPDSYASMFGSLGICCSGKETSFVAFCVKNNNILIITWWLFCAAFPSYTSCNKRSSCYSNNHPSTAKICADDQFGSPLLCFASSWLCLSNRSNHIKSKMLQYLRRWHDRRTHPVHYLPCVSPFRDSRACSEQDLGKWRLVWATHVSVG